MTLVGGNPGNFWANPYKAVKVSNNSIQLAVNGQSERYTEINGCPSIANWPCLILQQNNRTKISSLSSLYLSLDAKLDYFKKVTKNNCYATQLTFYMVLSDINANRNIWFGVSIFDNRYQSFEKSVGGYDERTHMGMYHIATSNVLKVNNKGEVINGNVKIQQNLLSAINEAMEVHHLSKNSTYITSTYIALENPSDNIATFTVSNLSLNTDSSSGGGNSGGGNAGANKNYLFNSQGNREGWIIHNMIEQFGGPYSGKWYFACNQSDPQMVSPILSGINGNVHKKVQIKMANAGNPAKYSYIKMYWKGKNDNSFSEARSAYKRIYNDGGWRTYTLYPNWSGEIKQIRIDPIAGYEKGIVIDEISAEAVLEKL